MLSASCEAAVSHFAVTHRCKEVLSLQYLPTCRGQAHDALLTIAEQQRSEAGARLRQQAQLLAAAEDRAAGPSAEAARLGGLPVAPAGEPDEVGRVAGGFWSAAHKWCAGQNVLSC